jgi:subtilisin family serine protease
VRPSRLMLLLGWLVVSACRDDSVTPTATPTNTPNLSKMRPGDSIPGRYIVILKDAASSPTAMAARATGLNGRVNFVYEDALRGFAADLDGSAVDALRRDPSVAAIYPDRVVSINGVQSPVPSWGLDRIDQRSLPLDNTYNYANDGTGVHVYIIDTGILRTHVDFGGRAVFGFSAINDGFQMTDCHGHGTHVAGTVGSATYGVAKNVRLHAVRVLDCSGLGTTSQVVAGIDWVTGHGIKPAVANMSLGGGPQPPLDQAVANSIKNGISYAIAAGNSNTDACNTSPARTPNAITVGATDINDRRASFSNVGVCVDVFGPGVAITSTWKTSNTATNILSGTSMATPHVTGAIARYLESNPTATPAKVTYAIKASATRGVVGNPGTGSPNLLVHAGLFGTGANLPPLASFDFNCTALGCSFNSGNSLDDHGITGRNWAFGDNSTGAGQIVSHTYAVGAIYTVQLTVKDAANLTGQISKTFKLPAAGGQAGNPPVPSFTAFPNAGLVEVDGTFSTDDFGIARWAWDFGDGFKATGSTAQHNYPQPNQFYTLTLTVYDLAGQFASKSIQVYPNSH